MGDRLGSTRLLRPLAAEALGTAGLLVSVVGSGIMGDRLAAGNDAITLLANSLATGFALIVLILLFGNVSGAHINPAVTLAATLTGDLRWKEGLLYVAAQVIGAFAGVAAANVMFDLPAFFVSVQARAGVGLFVSEIIATFGLLGVVLVGSRQWPQRLSFGVGLYIAAAYWFTSSTSFANPAVTVARAATDTFTGIRPVDVGPFLIAQIVGTLLAVVFFGWLVSAKSASVSKA